MPKVDRQIAFKQQWRLCARKCLVSCLQLKQIRVEVGSRPGERRVTSSASSSSSGSYKTSSEHLANGSVFGDDVDLNVQVIVTGNASGETSRVVRIPSKTVDHDRRCKLCNEPGKCNPFRVWSPSPHPPHFAPQLLIEGVTN